MHRIFNDLARRSRLRTGRSAHTLSGNRFQQPALHQHLGGIVNHLERQPRSLRDIKQRVFAVRLIQHPETRVDIFFQSVAMRSFIQAAPAELRLAKRTQVPVTPVFFQHVHNRGTNSQRFRQILRANEIQIVGRCVVLRKTSPHAAHQAADGKIETRRAILPLVISIRRKFQKSPMTKSDGSEHAPSRDRFPRFHYGSSCSGSFRRRRCT